MKTPLDTPAASRRSRVNIGVLHPQRKNGLVLTTCTQCGGTNSSHAAACFVCDAPLRRYTPADEPEPDVAAKFEADLMESLPEPVRAASERASATIAALCNSAPAPATAAEPAGAERKPAVRPRRAETRVYPGPAPEPAASAPVAAARAESTPPVSSRRAPRMRVTPVSTPAAVAIAEPPAKARVAVAEPATQAAAGSSPEIVEVATVPTAPSAGETQINKPITQSSAEATAEPLKKPRAAVDLSDPESSDKLNIAKELLSSSAPERIATAAEISSLKSQAPAAPAIRVEPAGQRKVAPIRVMPISAVTEPQWRQELTSRVEAYRARRRNSETSDSEPPQDSLPFSEPAIASDATQTDADTAPDPRASLRLHARARLSQAEKIEISTVQPELNFVAAEQMRPFAERLVPVAAIDDRRAAGLLDAGFLLLSYAGFLALFGSLGGRFSFSKLDLLVYGVTFFLFYVQYFALFTAFGGVTPGMGMRGLRVVAFDGTPAGARQLVWRSFGYVISAATMMLGFLWALWDEDQLTWHDRMSQTYLTSAPLTIQADSESR